MKLRGITYCLVTIVFIASCSQESLNVSQNIKDLSVKAYNASSRSERLELYLELYQIAEGDYKAYAANNIGKIAKQCGKYDAAIRYYKEALNLSTEKQQSTIYYNLGNIYRKKGDFEKSADFYLRGLDYAEANNDTTSIAEYTLQLGVSYSNLGMFDRSDAMLYNIVRDQNLLKTTELVGKAYHALGNNEMIKGNHQKAIGLFEQAITLHTREKNTMLSYLDIGECYSKLNDHGSAVEYFSKSEELFKDNHHKVFKLKALSLEQLGDNKAALVYSKKYYGLQDEKIQERDILVQMLSGQVFAGMVDNHMLKDQNNKKLAATGFIGLILLIVGASGFGWYRMAVKRKAKRKSIDIDDAIAEARP